MAPKHPLLRILLGLAVVLAILSVADGRGFRRHLQLEREISSLEQKNAQLEVENRGLGREIESLRKDGKSVERAAREELGFIKPGEVVINLE